MSILDKIKKFFSSEEIQAEIKKIKLEELDTELENQEKDIEKSKENLAQNINQKVKELVSELQNRLEKIEKINLDERKEEIKIKNIVKENLNAYIVYLKRLIEELRKIQPDADYIKNITRIFDSFKQNSKNSYEKATILIGKELGNINELIKRFSQEFNNILLENKPVFEKEKKIKDLKVLGEKIKKENQVKQEIDESLINLEQNLSNIKMQKEQEEKELQNITASEEYRKGAEEKLKNDREKRELEKEIQILKFELDLKLLAKHFHSNEKKSARIQKYLENFKLALEEDANIEIAEFVKEVNQNFNLNKISEMQERILKLKNQEEADIDKKVNKAEEKIKKSALETQYIQQEIEKEQDKKIKFREQIQELQQEIKEQAKTRLNIEITD